MQIPSIFHGSYRAVRKDSKRLAQAFAEGRSPDDLTRDLIASEQAQGVMILDEPRPPLQAGPHFYFGEVARWLLQLKGMDPKPWSRFYDWALDDPGCFLTALGQFSVAYMLEDEAYQRRFISAGLKYFPTLDREGPRYVTRTSPGVSQNLWDVPNGILDAMQTISGRNDWVFDPLPPGGLPELAAKLGVLPEGFEAASD